MSDQHGRDDGQVQEIVQLLWPLYHNVFYCNTNDTNDTNNFNNVNDHYNSYDDDKNNDNNQ